MIPTKEQFFTMIREIVEQVLEERNDAIPKVERATVGAFADNGEPLLLFEGEDIVSQKIYVRMRHYDDPMQGDRVLVIDDIIIGTWTVRKNA